MLPQKAKDIIYQAITPEGILASSIGVDNYKRIWSRDSMMTGIAGLLLQDDIIIEAHKNSILTLAKNQGTSGQIPSNVSIEEDTTKISYGTLVGRVDATTWWIIGTCLYLQYSKNEKLKNELYEPITKALLCLEAWEFNQRGLIYTPLGGNWADEYITTGYTLYDNVLRYWALQSAGEIYQHEVWLNKAKYTKSLIEQNFRKTVHKDKKYHPTAYEKAPRKAYFWAGFSANGYDTFFDLAGNALAMYLNFDMDIPEFTNYLHTIKEDLGHWMLPAFYPVIFPTDSEWKLLENNYSYQFKNLPYHFHNGGSWPIFLGWLCLALHKRMGRNDICKHIVNTYENLLKEQGPHFNEYYTTDRLQACGTEKLCFSATGYLLMKKEDI